MDLKKILEELKNESSQEKVEKFKRVAVLGDYYKPWYDCSLREISEIKDDTTRENYSYMYRDFFTNVLLPLYNIVIDNYPDFVIDNDPNKQTIKSMLYQLTRYCDKTQVKDVMNRK